MRDRHEEYVSRPANERMINFQIASLRLILSAQSFLFQCLKANFNPNQPRVPAGLPDGGQWTQIGGPSNPYAVDLTEQERFGGHTIKFHVGQSDSDLMRRMYQTRFEIGLGLSPPKGKDRSILFCQRHDL